MHLPISPRRPHIEARVSVCRPTGAGAGGGTLDTTVARPRGEAWEPTETMAFSREKPGRPMKYLVS